MTDAVATCPSCQQVLVPDAVVCPYCGERVPGSEECTDYAYEAFISYRHLSLDRNVAVKLQRSLESFSIPKSLRGQSGRAKLGKCFRDEDELPTSSSLSDQIRDALKRSRFLVVVCTPQTRESLWVQEEVLLFASYHGRDKILVALAAGEPDESFPELLLSRLEPGSDGTVRTVDIEPIAADFRDLSRGKFRQERLRIAAPLVGCGFDDLRQRVRMRRMHAIAAIASGVAAMSVAFGGFSAYQQAQITQNYRAMQVEESEFLANEATELLAKGDRYQAIQVALAALPESSASDDRPFVPAAQMALEKALQVYPAPERWRPCYSREDVSASAVAYSKTGLAASIRPDRQVEVYEIATGDTVREIDIAGLLDVPIEGGEEEGNCLTFAGEMLVYQSAHGVLGCFDPRSGELQWREDLGGILYSGRDVAFARDGSLIAVAAFWNYRDETAAIYVLDAKDGRTVLTVELPSAAKLGIEDAQSMTAMRFSHDNRQLAVGRWGHVFLVDLATGEFTQKRLQFDYVDSVSYAREPRMVFAVSTDGALGMSFDSQTCLEVFDGDMNKLWDRQQVIGFHYSKHGIEYPSTVKVCGGWNYRGDDDTQLVVLFDSDILLLDVKTGKEELCLPADSPYLDCVVSDCVGGPRIYAMTADGDIIYRVPLAENRLPGGLYQEVNVGECVQAEFIEADETMCVSVDPLDSPKRALYRYEGVSETRGAQPTTTSLQDARYTWGFEYIGGTTDAAAVIWDGNTFEERAHWEFADLDAIASNTTGKDVYSEYFGVAGKLVLVAPGKENDDGSSEDTAVYVFDAQSASIDSTFTIEGFRKPIGGYDDSVVSAQFDSDNRVVVTVRDGYDVTVVRGGDPVSVIAQVHRDYPTSIRNAWFAGGNILLFENTVFLNDEGDRVARQEYQFELVDAETGDSVASDLAGYLPQSMNAHDYSAFDSDGSRMIMACDDGKVRLFDTASGAMLWEVSASLSKIRNVWLAHEGDAIVQDSTGHLIQLAADDGRVKRASSTVLDPIIGFMLIDDTTLVAAYEKPGLQRHGGIALIPTDAESLDPISDMYYGMSFSHDGKSALLFNSANSTMYQIPRYSLDELIEMGREMVEGHELTDAERHLYQLD